MSAYYVGVARNVLEGEGMVSEAVWSYATPPLVVPKPAFDLWLPMATLIALPSMLLFGPSLAAAQLAHAVVGALLAPLAWLVARDAAGRSGVPTARATWIAVGSGALAALLGPLVVAVAGPDSATPFATFAVASALAVPAALGDRDRRPSAGAGFVLGVLLGLTYLSRQEAVFLGFVVAALALALGPRRLAALLPVAAGGAVVVVPWLLRNLATFGSLFPGQAVENALLVKSTDIFAWTDRPTVGRFLAQGGETLAENVALALRHNVVDVLLLSALPVGLVGILALPYALRSGALRGASPLRVLVLAGGLTLAFITLVFPVATLSGTWLHAASPTLVALVVLASLGADAVVARIGGFRRWERNNAWLAPLALIVIAVPMALLQVRLVTRQAEEEGVRVRSVAAALEGLSDGADGTTTVSDHPIWLAETSGRASLALPEEPPATVHELATHFGARTVVIFDERGPYPGALDAAAPCFTPIPLPDASARAYEIAEDGCPP